MTDTRVDEQTLGDVGEQHSHAALLHTHDHYHVSHRHLGHPTGEFEHQSNYHTHEHNHAPVLHGHRGRSAEDELEEHNATAHVHDHDSPTGEGM